jgi:hypothetical protein
MKMKVGITSVTTMSFDACVTSQVHVED